MLSDISAGGWLVIFLFMALGFGLVRFFVVSMRERFENSTSTPYRGSNSETGSGSRDEKLKSYASEDETYGDNSELTRTPRDWYEVLGIAANASNDQIRAAYRKKIALYHPDKVSSLGPEFSVVAERKTKEINAAYERCIAARS